MLEAKHNGHDRRRARRYLVAFLALAFLATAVFVYPRISSSSATAGEPQQRRRRTRPGGGQPQQTSRRPRVDYTRFSHNTKEHVKYDDRGRANCTTCHALASPLQYDIKDFPDHPFCTNCHRQEFFLGARPPICIVCHKSSSPREVRPRPFPKPGVDITSDLPGRFPHDRHQDLLALRPRTDEHNDGVMRLLRASFDWTSGTAAQTQEQPQQENCATCHGSYDKANKVEAKFFPGTGWPTNMLPGVGTFRKNPDGPAGHRTCFVCHASSDSNEGWKSPLPVANDCAGCHTAARPAAGQPQPTTRPTPAPGAMSGVRTTGLPTSFKFAEGVMLPRRVTFTFQHEGGGSGGSHNRGCTTCHINIARQQTLIVEPDVPIASCAICHTKAGATNQSLKKTKEGESPATITAVMDAWVESKKRDGCVLCHIVKQLYEQDPPCTHYDADKKPRMAGCK